jgi:hypothetical protein
LPQELVFSGEQVLHKIVPALIRVAGGAGEMMIDSHAGGAAEIIRDRKNFVGRFTLAEQPLRLKACRADGCLDSIAGNILRNRHPLESAALALTDLPDLVSRNSN